MAICKAWRERKIPSSVELAYGKDNRVRTAVIVQEGLVIAGRCEAANAATLSAKGTAAWIPGSREHYCVTHS
jgi:hypothetical protein